MNKNEHLTKISFCIHKEDHLKVKARVDDLDLTTSQYLRKLIREDMEREEGKLRKRSQRAANAAKPPNVEHEETTDDTGIRPEGT